MKLLADENFPITAFRLLQQFGFDIKHVAFEMPSVADTDVMDLELLPKIE